MIHIHHQVDEREQHLGDAVQSGIDDRAAALGNREDADADHHREHVDLQQLALRERADEVVGHDVRHELEETLRRGGLRHRRRGAGGDVAHAPADLQQVAGQQADDERDRRDDLEVDDRAPADAAGALHVTGRRDAVHDRQEDERRDAGLDQRQEHVAEQLQLRGERREDEADDDAECECERDLHAELAPPAKFPGRSEARGRAPPAL
jgi:hypothetical protein